MEHREAPRMATAEAGPRDAGPDPDLGRRFARFLTSPTPRKLAPTRLVPVLIALAGAVVVLVVVGSQALHGVISFVHGQPHYHLRFQEIELDPPPPAWYRGGSERFMGRVLENTPGRGETISVLDEDLKVLTNDFKLYAWVARVSRVTRSYRKIAVALEYRTPVAFAFEGPLLIVLDREGIILPHADLDLEAAGPLVRICDLEPPRNPQTGLPWKVGDAARGLEQADPRVLAASRMAEFLKSVAAREEGDFPALRFLAVHPAPRNPRKWFVELDNQLMIFWEGPPGGEADGEPSAEAKWSMFREWARRHDLRTIHYPHYVRFTKDGVVIAFAKPSSEPRRIASGGNGHGLSY